MTITYKNSKISLALNSRGGVDMAEKMPRILVIDEARYVHLLIQRDHWLTQHVEIEYADTYGKAVSRLSEPYDIITIGSCLDTTDGLSLLGEEVARRIKQEFRSAALLIACSNSESQRNKMCANGCERGCHKARLPELLRQIVEKQHP